MSDLMMICEHRSRSRPYIGVSTSRDFPGTEDGLDGARCLDCGQDIYRPSIIWDRRRSRNAWTLHEAIDATTLKRPR